MGNVQGRLHRRRNRRGRKAQKVKTYEPTLKDIVPCDKMIFVDGDDGEYVWETHVVGRLPFKEPLDYDIVFHNDKLWQDDTDGWSLLVLTGDDDYSDSEV
jgi:hypothetical protein